MNILDLFFLICIIPAIIEGLKEGFIRQVIGIISLIAGVWASYKFSTMTGAWVATWLDASGNIINIVSFALVFLVVLVILGALGRLLEGIIKFGMLGWANRLLGLIFSLLKCALILGLVVMLFNQFNSTYHWVSDETLAASKGYAPIRDLANSVFPYIKNLFVK